MDMRTVYCSACDRNVVIMATADEAKPFVLNEDGSSHVCLDYGEKCTGEMCPILAIPSAQVRENLATLKAKQ